MRFRKKTYLLSVLGLIATAWLGFNPVPLLDNSAPAKETPVLADGE